MKLLLWVLVPTRLAIWWARLTQRDHNPLVGEPRIIHPISSRHSRRPGAHDAAIPRIEASLSAGAYDGCDQEAYRSILETNPCIDDLLSVSSVRNGGGLKPVRYLLGALRFYWRNLRGRRFDVAISPRWDTDEHLATLLCWLTRAELRVGYGERASKGKRRFNRGFDRVFDICLDPGPLRHEVERNIAIVDALGQSINDTATEITVTAEDREYASQALQDVSASHILVALGIGAQSPGRRWPLERYSAVIDELSEEYRIHTVITCAPSDHEQATHLARALPEGSTISDGAAIRETCALLALCDLFIGNDTGAAHLAAAMQCPSIVISRHPKHGDPEHPNGPARFAPWGVPGRVIQPEHGLDNCKVRCQEISCPDCITQISAPEVVAAANTILMRSSRVRDKLKASSTL